MLRANWVAHRDHQPAVAVSVPLPRAPVEREVPSRVPAPHVLAKQTDRHTTPEQGEGHTKPSGDTCHVTSSVHCSMQMMEPSYLELDGCVMLPLHGRHLLTNGIRTGSQAVRCITHVAGLCLILDTHDQKDKNN